MTADDRDRQPRRPMADMRARTEATRRRLLQGLAVTLAVLPSAAAAQDAGSDVSLPDVPADLLPPESPPDEWADDVAGAAPDTAQPAQPVTVLRAGPAQWPLKPAPAQPTGVLAYGGQVPGPVLRVRRGAAVQVRLDNALDQPSSLHWHGVRLPNPLDGVAGLTQEAVAPGAGFDIAFKPQDAGTFYYRPFVPALAAEQTERGLYGLFIVEDEKEPPFDRELAVVVDDWALDATDSLRPSFGDPAETAFAGRLGNWLTVNSRTPPETVRVAPGARVRVRLVNAANARPFTLRFDRLKVHVLAVDGQPCEPFAPARGNLAIVPGGRLDLAVDVPAEPGAVGAILAALGPGVPLVSFETEGSPSPLLGTPVLALPANDLPAAIDLRAAARADLVIAGGRDPATTPADTPPSVADPARLWTVNGVAWPDARAKPVLSVKSGRPVSLGLVNRSPFLQVLHLHGHTARLLHALDDGWDPYWLDTIAVPPGTTARIAFIAGMPGRWMISSSILERLSTGLACWFEVT